MSTKQNLLHKIASDAPLREALLSLIKTSANNDNASTGGKTEFDETVPSAEQNSMYGDQAPEQNQSKSAAEAQLLPPDQAAQLNQPQAMPEEIGARAAQAFIGPDVLNAAMQGDQHAMQLVAMATGNVASATADAFAKSQMQAVPQGQVPAPQPDAAQETPQGARMVGSTPEEQIANMIVPASNTPTATPIEQGQEKQSSDETADIIRFLLRK